MSLLAIVLLAQGGGDAVFIIVILGIVVLALAGLWATFSKAGEPGWACIVPIYNMIVLCRIGGKPEWWFLLMLIPLVGIIIQIVVLAGVAENFGKGGGFVVGLIFLPFIFYPLLGFGDAEYVGARG
jgi:hypothetical protein